MIGITSYVNVYINNEYLCDKLFLPGVIAHELGHAISGISHYTFIPSLKVSTMLSRIFHLTITAFYNSKRSWLNNLAYVFYVPYYIINLNNIIFTYRFLRNDEITANKVAVKLGFGDYLRCYYGIALNIGEDPFLRKCDFFHPSIKEMLNNMNKDMNINYIESCSGSSLLIDNIEFCQLSSEQQKNVVIKLIEKIQETDKDILQDFVVDILQFVGEENNAIYCPECGGRNYEIIYEL